MNGRAAVPLSLTEGVDLLLGRKSKARRAARGRSVWTGVPVNASPPHEHPGRGSKADALARLRAMTRKSPQVLVKVPAQGRKTAKALRAHFKYLARDGEETLIDQDGRQFLDREGLQDLYWAWKHVGPSLSEASSRKEALHIIFSMREGTDERAVFGAVKATAEVEFAGHQWVMVQHHDEPQVHVHVCVKIESMDGCRLNPRKADLQRWREWFAHELRQRGVEAEATRRTSRLQREKVRRPWEVAQMEARGQTSRPLPPCPDPAKVAGWRRTESEAVSYCAGIAQALGRSQDMGEQLLATQFSDLVRERQKRNQVLERHGVVINGPDVIRDREPQR
jgi:hypothetical protein